MAINPLSGTGNHSQPSPILPTPHTPQKSETARATVTPISNAQAGQSEKSPASDAQVKQAVEKIQNSVDKLAQNLQFSIDEDTGKTVVKVLDSQTQEVIRQFPSEEAISIARALDKAQGLLFNDKA